MLRSINPTTETVIFETKYLENRDLLSKIELSWQGFLHNSNSSVEVRADKINRAGQLFIEKKETLARLATEEMGKPYSQAESEVLKCARALKYYATNIFEFAAPRPQPIVDPVAKSIYLSNFPLGPILAIMPWNFPYWQVIRFLAPNLALGNSILLKHAPNVSLAAMALEKLFREAGFVNNEFLVLFIDATQVPDVIAHTKVAGVTLTGSTKAGSSVASLAGKYLKPVVLELGGSDPFIITESADLDRAVEVGINARCQNNGQSCIAAKRIFVHRSIYDEALEKFISGFNELNVGNPIDKDTDIGPLATEQVLENALTQIKDAKEKGAKILVGGNRINSKGYFVEPTIIVDIKGNMSVFNEEVFAPVASIFKFDDIEQAVTLANKTQYGLGAAIFSQDQTEIDYFIKNIQSGLAFVNSLVASYPELPFGGIKNSGFGRELGVEGYRSFSNTKTIFIG